MSTSVFLNLPGEIRNQIYGLLLIVPPPHVPRSLRQPPPLHPEILSVCHQIYRETCQILYGKNTFIAHYSLLSELPQLRPSLGPVRSNTLIAMIKRYHIYVRLDCDARFTAIAAQKAFSGVESLTVEVFQSQFGSSDYRILQRFEKIRGIKEAKIIGSVVGFPAYVNWLEQSMVTPEGCIVEDFDEQTADNGE
jgi:hypothetical protein